MHLRASLPLLCRTNLKAWHAYLYESPVLDVTVVKACHTIGSRGDNQTVDF